MFNDPLGDQAGPITQSYGGMHGGYARSGPGSGEHWSDGMPNSDWSLFDGSDAYSGEIVSGMWDTGGFLSMPGGGG